MFILKQKISTTNCLDKSDFTSNIVSGNYDSLSSREISMKFVQKTKISLSYKPTIPLLNMATKKSKST